MAGDTRGDKRGDKQNFSERVKSELLNVKFQGLNERRACLSAFVRSCGTICSEKGLVGFEIPLSNDNEKQFVTILLRDLYKIDPEIISSVKRGKSTLRLVSEKSADVLCDLKIIEKDESGVAVKLGIDESLTQDKTRAAYVRGLFLGSGSVTVPKVGADEEKNTTGYHLEFVFANYQTATDLCEVLSEAYLMPRLTDRKETYIVYFKTIDEVSDVLALMGASKAVMELSEIAVEKDMNNDMNRKINCEMSNMVKQMDASVKQIRAINRIAETKGLNSLPLPLKQVAEARLSHNKSTLAELADILKISKSCLNHRLRKIIEIADEL